MQKSLGADVTSEEVSSSLHEGSKQQRRTHKSSRRTRVRSRASSECVECRVHSRGVDLFSDMVSQGSGALLQFCEDLGIEGAADMAKGAQPLHLHKSLSRHVLKSKRHSSRRFPGLTGGRRTKSRKSGDYKSKSRKGLKVKQARSQANMLASPCCECDSLGGADAGANLSLHHSESPTKMRSGSIKSPAPAHQNSDADSLVLQAFEVQNPLFESTSLGGSGEQTGEALEPSEIKREAEDDHVVA